MQKTYAQRREEMKAKIAAYAEEGKKLFVGKRIIWGRYTFEVKHFENNTLKVRVEMTDKYFRSLVMDIERKRVFSLYGHPMTAALLKAFCEVFVEKEDRAEVFDNSSTHGTRIRHKFPNPFGV